jgi:hypothetical protein
LWIDSSSYFAAEVRHGVLLCGHDRTLKGDVSHLLQRRLVAEPMPASGF